MKKSAAEVWCRGCRHYGYDGPDGCPGVRVHKAAKEQPPCVTWPEKSYHYEPNKDGEPNW
jgi:hypothetical protein